MKKIPTLFLQGIIILVGIAALAFLLVEPHFEGRNVNATPFQVYFNDPFLAYAYAASLLFFSALYQAFKVLGYVRHNKTFSQETLKALQTVKYCTTALAACIAAPVLYLFVVRPGDDIAGGVAIGLFLTLASSVIAAAAAMTEGIVQDAADMKFEED